MEHQRTGVLECWSNGVMERVKEKKGVELEIVLIRSTPILQYSITPVVQYSIFERVWRQFR
jgi:hypothetical protein